LLLILGRSRAAYCKSVILGAAFLCMRGNPDWVRRPAAMAAWARAWKIWRNPEICGPEGKRMRRG